MNLCRKIQAGHGQFFLDNMEDQTHGPHQNKVNQGNKNIGGNGAKCWLESILASPMRSGDSNEENHGRVLNHGDELVGPGRNNQAQGLGQDNMPDAGQPLMPMARAAFICPRDTDSRAPLKYSHW